MTKPSLLKLVATIVTLGAWVVSGCAHRPDNQGPKADIGFLRLEKDVALRTMVVRNPRSRGTVLLLHGFPETLYAWKDLAQSLGEHYEVHAIDWPGYGLSSRPAANRFSYSPRDYARVLKHYIEKSAVDPSNLTIYATDIGALPALLLALEEPRVARTIIVGDFAPFNRPHYMHENLQRLKADPSSHEVRALMNRNREEILENAFRRGLPKEAQFEVSREFKEDMARGWSQGEMTTADAFYHYYSHFTRDQDYLEANLTRLKIRVKVVWGENDIYIKKEMGVEFAKKANAEFILLPGIGHYPHLQNPKQAIEQIHASFR